MTKKVTIDLQLEDHKNLKKICIEKDLKIKEYVTEILLQHINEDIKDL